MNRPTFFNKKFTPIRIALERYFVSRPLTPKEVETLDVLEKEIESLKELLKMVRESDAKVKQKQ